ncbi:hypothetical protein DHX103_06755 [Planococcus sp. X10-3]|uniref:hypothetical protein n=1 Tax=Planococcus sp. X10-3 TaxID=3061240 RepID=UPI003BB0BAF1
MKASIITIVLFYIVVFIIGVAIQDVIFPWGGVAESHLKPIYLGLIVLSGLIVGCTVYLADALKASRVGSMKTEE